MKLKIDDNDAMDFTPPGQISAADFVHHLRSERLIKGDVVVMELDTGHEIIDPSGVDTADLILPWDEIAALTVRTARFADVLYDSIEDGRKTCVLVSTESRKTADILRDGKIADGADSLKDLMENIGVLVNYSAALVDHLKDHAAGFSDDDYTRLRNRLQETLEEMLGFQETSDWIMLSDLLEYELGEIFEELERILGRAADLLRNGKTS